MRLDGSSNRRLLNTDRPASYVESKLFQRLVLFELGVKLSHSKIQKELLIMWAGLSIGSALYFRSYRAKKINTFCNGLFKFGLCSNSLQSIVIQWITLSKLTLMLWESFRAKCTYHNANQKM